jgi:hypothetical protein
LLRGNNGCRLKDCQRSNIFASLAPASARKKIFQEDMPMQRAFSIPHVPVVLSEVSLTPPRVDIRAVLRTAGDRCLVVLRRFVDVMASGGAMS